MKLLFIAILFAYCTTSAFAWWGKAHLAVARIAYDILQTTSEGQASLDKANQLLTYLKRTDPGWTKKEGEHPFVECATFADDIKNRGGRYEQGWHFVDIPVLDQDQNISHYNFTYDEHNVTEAIVSLVSWFNRTPGYQDLYDVQQIMDHRYNCSLEQCALSTAMRFLIHFVGDTHQPLHASSRVDGDFPQGDRGGNDLSIPITGHEKVAASNLHEVWDSILYTTYGYAELPYTDQGWKELGTYTARLQSEYPMEAAVINDLDPYHWADEAWHYAKTFVYEGVVDGQPLSDEYIAQGQKICEKQVVIAGNRLAILLNSLPLESLDLDVDPSMTVDDLEESLQTDLIKKFNGGFLEKIWGERF